MKNKIAQLKVKITASQKISRAYFKLSFFSPQISAFAQPGQFVEIKASENNVVFLRRPFGIHHVEKGKIDCLIEKVGPATEILSRKKAGDYLDIIGPLGSGFKIKAQGTIHKIQVLVAGGMGVAPLVFLAEKLREIPNLKSQIPTLVLIGAKTKKQILCEKEFKKLGCDVKIATDDGSRGFKGKVTDLLKTCDLQSAIIYACGPKPMLKEISRLARSYDFPAQISLEEHMSCGIGACLGCAVKTKEGFKRVCKEGPVFDAEEIIWT